MSSWNSKTIATVVSIMHNDGSSGTGKPDFLDFLNVAIW